MNTNEVRAKFIAFYQKLGHTAIPAAALVPENDPTTLFTGSGMQPLVPYLLGQKHPLGTRLVNSQKAFRSGDIEDIGDNRHFTFFEMLGNWSLGSYFKDEQIPWVFSFLTDEVKIDPKKLFVTVFIGDEKNGIAEDSESVALWKKLFAEKGIDAADARMGSEEEATQRGMKPGERIFYYSSKKNWWSRSGVPEKMPAGEPGGPDSEMFYEFSHIEHNPAFGPHCHPNCDCGRYLEIGNSVFMEFVKNADGTFSKLPQRNVDFGGGLERIAAVSDDKNDMFLLDIFAEGIRSLEHHSGKKYSDPAHTAAFRIILDHVRSASFLIADGVTPSNSDRGYYVRRLIRRAVRYMDVLGIAHTAQSALAEMAGPIITFYKDAYPETFAALDTIKREIAQEEEKFRATLAKGTAELKRLAEKGTITGTQAFDLYQTFGFPLELTKEILNVRQLESEAYFASEMKKHQDLSRAGSEKKFKGGLADTSDMSLRYHTATHLLNAALREVLGTHVMQKGSNITPERLRFDFSHGQKMTDDEKQRVQDIVNRRIQEALPVSWQELPKEEALKLGAIHAFGEKYGDIVKVYTVGDDSHGIASREFCGGPHVTNTANLAGPEKFTFKIQKEEAVSAGVRRIKAVLS